jgi:iron complex outermembrane receptor protein
VGPALCEPLPEDPAGGADVIGRADPDFWRRGGHHGLTGDTRPATPRTGATDPVQLAAELARNDGTQTRAAFGTKLENGLELALSATHVTSDRTHTFSYGLTKSDAVARAFDYDRSTKIDGKAGFGAFKMTAAHSERNQGVLGSHFGAVFADPTSSLDKNTLVDFAHSTRVRQFGVTTRVFHGSYAFRGDQLYPAELYVDTAESEWWGTQLKASGNVFGKHRLLVVADYQRNEREANRDTGAEPYARHQGRQAESLGFLLEDEYAWRPTVALTGGARYDFATIEPTAHVSPRFGLTYKPGPLTTAKLRYVHALRNPTAYGSSYAFTALPMGSELRAERVRSAEAVLELAPAKDVLLTSTVYSSRTDGAIRQVTDAATGMVLLQNEPRFEAHGVELAAEARPIAQTKVRASYTLQAVDSPPGFARAPRDVAHVTVSGPVPSSRLTAAFETHYTTSRHTAFGEVGGLGLTNLTLRYRVQSVPVELSASAYNLLDRQYGDPITGERGTPPGDPFELGGRTIGLKAVLWL